MYLLCISLPIDMCTLSSCFVVVGVAKPFFNEPLQDQVVNEGSVVRLTTTFGGEPEPHIQWLCNNNPIQSSAVFKVSAFVKVKVKMFPLFVKVGTLSVQTTWFWVF